MSAPIRDNSREQSLSHSDDADTTKSGASSLPRTNRRNGARVARIVQQGVELNQRISDLIVTGNTPTVKPSSYPPMDPTPDIPSFLNKSQVPCRGQVINGHICFRLIPQIPRLLCPFNFTHSIGHNVVLDFKPNNVTVPYVLNGTPSIYSGKEVDITNILVNGQNELLVNTQSVNEETMISIEWRDLESPESIVNRIVNEGPHMELPPFNSYISEICPISQKIIVYPGRGSICAHCQCFDLLAFLTQAQTTNNWNCPICGQILRQDMLRFDPSYLKNCGNMLIGVDDFMVDDGGAAAFF